MSGKKNIIIGVSIGILATVIVFCLAVCIGSAINGLKFGAQVSQWFGANSQTVAGEMASNITFLSKLMK